MLVVAWSATASPLSVHDIPDSAYVRVGPEGYLVLGGERVRFWSWIGHFWPEGELASQCLVLEGDTPDVVAAKVKRRNAVFDALAERIKDLGFNMARIWLVNHDWDYDYTPGDGSMADLNAYVLYALDRQGIKVWATVFNDYGFATPDDVSAIDDADSASAWVDAVKAMGGVVSPRQADIGAWDARMAVVHKRRMKHIAHWPNKYKGGLRLGDDPQVGVWELSNEEWMFARAVNGQWQELPSFFVEQLRSRWHGFLRQKYGSDTAMREAWSFLLPDESIDQGTVLIAPLAQPVGDKQVNDANPAALEALTARRQTLTRDDFTRQRGSDVLEFFSQLQIAYKTDRRDYARTLGRSLRLSPIVLDTGDGFRIQSVHLHQQGDAVAMCSYLWQTAISRSQKRFPFVSGLEETPRLSMGVPWLEVGRVPGKPFFVYEFQTNNPDKYRAEVPYRIAALGAIQDWDIINFHLFGRPNNPSKANPYSGPLEYSVHSPGWAGATVEGVHYKHDEIYASAMKAAGLFFRQGLLNPVEQPTVMTFGRRSLYDPISADYGKSFGELGRKIGPTAWEHACYMRVDSTQEHDQVRGKTVERGLMESNPVRPTDQIAFNWQSGYMSFDTPSGVAWVGFLADQSQPVTFRHGVSLSDVVVINDKGMTYPVGEDELYVAFACVAQDGEPLHESRHVLISLVSTSFNWGFELNLDNVDRGFLGHTGKPYEGMTRGGDIPGVPPVAYSRAGATVISAALDGMNYRLKDWHFNTIASGKVRDSKLVIPADRPVFFVDLFR